MLESELEAVFRRQVEKAGGMALKFVSPGRAGVPDRIVLVPGGRMFFVEMKRPGGKMRPLQLQVAAKLQRLGHPVTVVDGRDALQKFLAKLEAPLICSDEYRAGFQAGVEAARKGGDAK